MKVRSKGTKLDFTATAASVVSRAIGENLFDGSPLPDPNAGKDPKAIARGRAGGLKGGKASEEGRMLIFLIICCVIAVAAGTFAMVDIARHGAPRGSPPFFRF